MDAKVHPLVAALVIAAAIAAIAAWMWGSGEAKAIGGPAQLLAAPDGRVYVQMQDVLLEHDAAGRFVRRHELADIGVHTVLGGIGIFSNGDLLIRRGADDRTLLDNLRAYQRRTNLDSLTPESGDAGLFRCSLESKTCEIFGESRFDFKAAYNVYIEWTSDDVYISDTTRHLLRKYSATGDALAGPVGDFRFPNQLLLVDDRLYVADTNHHRIAVLDPATATFADELDSIDVVPGAAERAKQRWPSRLARVGSEWWVNIMRTGMNEGGIYVFDSNWRYVRRIELPRNADPIDILPVANDVLISDWNNDRVYRISASGYRVEEFESDGLTALVQESVDARRQYQVYAYLGIGLFVFVIAALLVAGLAVHMSSGRGDPRGDPKHAAAPAAIDFPDELVWLTPDPARVRKIRVGMRLAALLFLLLFATTGYLLLTQAKLLVASRLWLPVVGVTLIYALLYWAARTNYGSAIGLRGKTITLRDHRGREQTVPLADVSYDGATIAAGNMAVFLGQPIAPLYDRQSLMEHLYPRLAFGRSVSIWRMQLILLRMKHPQGIMGVGMLLILVAAAISYLTRAF